MIQLLLTFLFATFSEGFQSGQIYCINKVQDSWKISENCNRGAAVGSFVDNIQTTGWVELTLQTSNNFDDQTQAYAAGYLEGALTVDYIWNSFQTFNQTLGLPNNSWFDSRLITFVVNQDKWVRDNAKKNNTPYWSHVKLILDQLDGIIAGYRAYAPPDKALTYLEWLFFQLQPEWGDIESSWNWQPSALLSKTSRDAHCSVLVRLSDDKKDLFSSHVTWTSFVDMLRVYKTYNFAYRAQSTNANTISFSSYPGVLCSTDDYYTTSPSRLTVMETTNGVMNQSLFVNYISPKTVPFWIRVMLATRMANGGKDWAEYFAAYNSGTYNNQYQIVDYKLFVPHQKNLKDNLLWIVEQVPGYVMSADKTDVMRKQGFWPSYNIPYFKFIYDISNYTAYFNLYGNSYSYTKCPRAQIFGRDAPKVNSMQQFKRIMRYNNYQNDPLSLQDACNAISSRCDLNVPWGSGNDFSAFGAIDCKVTNQELIARQTSEAVNGPTWDSQPPFAWTDQWPMAQNPHYGQPKVFAFDFAPMRPKSFRYAY